MPRLLPNDSDDHNERHWRAQEKLRELLDSFGDALSPEERRHLEQAAGNVRGGVNFDDPAAVEAELERLDRERLQRNFKPLVPLYGALRGGNKNREVKKGNDKPVGKPTRASNDARKSYQNDPRYKEFYDRLKREAPPPPDYEEDVQPMTLEELEESGWNGEPGSAPEGGPKRAPQRPAQRPVPTASSIRQHPRAPAGELVPGTIFLLDDDSVAIYKDAVSGKDYALFYFLEGDDRLSARGIFLEQYDRQMLGRLPADLFSEMVESQHWDYDALVYHLDDYRFASYVRMAASGTASGEAEAPTRRRTRETPSRPRPVSIEEPHQSHASFHSTPPPLRRDPLERGRVLRVNIAGHVWEAVYWTRDEIGPIVAHDTNREWQLMHLDLGRFKDSLDYGDLLDPGKLSEIEESLAKKGK